MSEPLDLDALQALTAELVRAVTDGAWTYVPPVDGRGGYIAIDGNGFIYGGCVPEIARFVVAARTAVPALVARIRVLEAAIPAAVAAERQACAQVAGQESDDHCASFALAEDEYDALLAEKLSDVAAKIERAIRARSAT